MGYELLVLIVIACFSLELFYYLLCVFARACM